MSGPLALLAALSLIGPCTDRSLGVSMSSSFDRAGPDSFRDAEAERVLDRLTESVLSDLVGSRRSARGSAAALLDPRGLRDAEAAGDSLPGEVGRAVTEEVRAEIGERWRVPPDRVRLEWGLLSSQLPGSLREVRVLGTGSGGHWVVVLVEPSGETMNVRVRAGVFQSRTVAARELQRGEVLTGGDLRRETHLGWGPPDPREPTVDEGWEVRRRIREGEVLRAPAVTRPRLVGSGESIEVVWRRGPIAISLRGEALASGSLGDSVMVRTEHGRRLTGTILGRGVVLVGQSGRRQP